MANSAESKNTEVVQRYFDGCNSGDVQSSDHVENQWPTTSLRQRRISGAEQLARHWRKFKQVLIQPGQ
jgi:hypothetical protein